MMHLIATFGGVGFVRPAPGTWGSLAALPPAFIILWLGGPLALIAGIAVVTALGVKATEVEVRSSLSHDPGHVVIDEVAGQWIALLPVGIGAWWTGAGLLALWPGWIAAFVLFRFFDIVKPGPIGRADQRGDAWGVMLDDLIAGAFAAVGVVIVAVIGHGIGALI